jgi:dipeptidyl-peptidase III
VALHEILGHGVGKPIHQGQHGCDEIFDDLDQGDKIQSCYGPGENFGTRFGPIATAYEECRADTCAFFLQTLPEVYGLFGFKDSEVPTLLWVNVMSQLRKGILGLQLFNIESNKWGQAHT